MEEKNVAVFVDGFEKRKDLLVCVDSDGCAINSMEYRHRRCFGPMLVKEWSLVRWENGVLELWNRINLYSETRGVNRFRGLALALKEINETIQPVGGVGHLLCWVDRTDELSNSSLLLFSSKLFVSFTKFSSNTSLQRAIAKAQFFA